MSPSFSGSCVLTSRARAVLVTQTASDDTEDDRVVIMQTKKNDGPLAPRTAWNRCAGWFESVTDFDFEAFDEMESRPRQRMISEVQICKALASPNTKNRAADELEEPAECGRWVAYEALQSRGGRFAHLFLEDQKPVFYR